MDTLTKWWTVRANLRDGIATVRRPNRTFKAIPPETIQVPPVPRSPGWSRNVWVLRFVDCGSSLSGGKRISQSERCIGVASFEENLSSGL